MKKIRQFFRKENESILSKNDFKNIEDVLQSIVSEHLNNKLSPVSRNETMKSVFMCFKSIFEMNLGVISEKVRLCLSDKNMHSWSFADPSRKMQVETTVIPTTLQNGQFYFSKLTPPGYLTFLNKMVNNYPFSIRAREQGIEILSHLIVCVDKSIGSIEINLTVLSYTDKNLCPIPVLPIELLSDQEKYQIS